MYSTCMVLHKRKSDADARSLPKEDYIRGGVHNFSELDRCIRAHSTPFQHDLRASCLPRKKEWKR